MNAKAHLSQRVYAAAAAVLFCTGFMGESIHYAWVQHERCAAHGEWSHADAHDHQEALSSLYGHHEHEGHSHTHSHSHHVETTETNGHQLPQVTPIETDNHDHCSLGEFNRDDSAIAWQISVDELSATLVATEAGSFSNTSSFLPITVLHLAPKHAPPGYVA